MANTSEIHTRMEGIPVEIMDGMIKLGVSSNKTEALRLALLDYDEHHDIIKKLREQLKKSEIDEEEKFYEALVRESNKSVWDNPKDEEAAKWYEEQIKKGAYDEYQTK